MQKNIINENLKRVEEGKALTIPLSILNGYFKQRYHFKKKIVKEEERINKLLSLYLAYEILRKRFRNRWFTEKSKFLKELSTVSLSELASEGFLWSEHDLTKAPITHSVFGFKNSKRDYPLKFKCKNYREILG